MNEQRQTDGLDGDAASAIAAPCSDKEIQTSFRDGFAHALSLLDGKKLVEVVAQSAGGEYVRQLNDKSLKNLDWCGIAKAALMATRAWLEGKDAD